MDSERGEECRGLTPRHSHHMSLDSLRVRIKEADAHDGIRRHLQLELFSGNVAVFLRVSFLSFKFYVLQVK